MIVKVHLDTLSAAKNASLSQVSLEDNLHNRLGVPVPCVLHDADVIHILEAPSAADTAIGTVLAQRDPIFKSVVVLTHEELHGAERLVDLVDAVIDCAYEPSWLPLFGKDLTVVDPVAVFPAPVVVKESDVVGVDEQTVVVGAKNVLRLRFGFLVFIARFDGCHAQSGKQGRGKRFLHSRFVDRLNFRKWICGGSDIRLL